MDRGFTTVVVVDQNKTTTMAAAAAAAATDTTSVGTIGTVLYKSILPPVTEEIRKEYALDQKLKEEKTNTDNNNNDHDNGNDTVNDNNTSVSTNTNNNNTINKSNTKVVLGCEKRFGNICGVPTLMCILFTGFAIGVIVYAVITAIEYDPSMSDDLVKPPYYSPTTPTTTPTMATPTP